MKNLVLLAQHTFRQVIRQKTFLNVGLFGLAILGVGMVVGNLTYGDPTRVFRSIGLSGVVLASDLVALLIGVTLVYRDIEDRTLYIIFARPVRRWEYLVGRHLGLFAAASLVLVGFSFFFVVALWITGGSAQAADAAALVAALPEVSFMAALGVAISTITTPSIGVGVGMGVWIAAASIDDVERLVAQQGGSMADVVSSVASFFPQLAHFDLRTAAVYGEGVAATSVGMAWLYGFLYTILFLGLGVFALSRREFH